MPVMWRWKEKKDWDIIFSQVQGLLDSPIALPHDSDALHHHEITHVLPPQTAAQTEHLMRMKSKKCAMWCPCNPINKRNHALESKGGVPAAVLFPPFQGIWSLSKEDKGSSKETDILYFWEYCFLKKSYEKICQNMSFHCSLKGEHATSVYLNLKRWSKL